MFTLNVPEEMLEKIHSMLEDEDEDTCISLREYKVGAGWHAKVVLGLGMEEYDEDDDEIKYLEIDNIKFMADEDFLVKYGRSFDLSFNENREVVLKALGAEG